MVCISKSEIFFGIFRWCYVWVRWNVVIIDRRKQRKKVKKWKREEKNEKRAIPRDGRSDNGGREERKNADAS